MNTLAPNSPDQRPNLHTADQQEVAPLSPVEQAQFDQLAQDFYNSPAEDPHLNSAQLGELAPVAEPSERRGLLARASVAVNHAKLSVGALGEKLRSEKAANVANPERSKKLRKALVVAGVTVGAMVAFSGKAYATTKGVESGAFDDFFQDIANNSGHTAAESVESFGGNHRAPGGANTAPFIEAPVDDTINEPKPSDPKPGQPKIGILPGTLTPYIIEEAPSTPANPNTPVNPADIQVKANQDPAKVLGKTWEMPQFDGKPENSLGGKMESYLKNAFEANNIDPKTMTSAEKQAVIDAFIKENDIKDTRSMHVGSYKSEATGNKISEVVKEHLAKDAEAKKTAAQKAAEAATELAKTKLTPEEIKALELDVTKLPKSLNLDVKVEHGDGLYSILDRQEGAAKLTPEQQQEVVQLLNSEKMRTSLLKFAPESFYDYQYPANYPDKNLAGTHELRLKYNDGHLLNTEQQKQIDEVYNRIIEEMEKAKKEADAKSTTTPPANPTNQTPPANPGNTTNPQTPNNKPSSAPSTPPPTSNSSVPPSNPSTSSSAPSPSVTLPSPTRGA